MNEEQLLIEWFAAYLHGFPQKKTWKEVDWKQFEAVALENKVVPLFFELIMKNHPEHFPVTIKEKFKSHASANARAALISASRLLHILRVLESHHIHAVPFKGLMLAEQVYGNMGSRHQGDMDLLVDRGDALQAMRLLGEMGYVSPYRFKEKSFHAFSASRGSIELNSIHGVGVIDLHWDLTNRYATVPYGHACVVKACKTVTLLNRPILTLSDEDLVIVLCFHGAKDRWERLERRFCLAYLIQQHPALDWEQMMEKAARLRASRTVLYGLFLAQRLFGVGLPEHIRREIHCREITFQKIHNSSAADRNSMQKLTATRFDCFHFKLRDNRQDQCRYFFHLLVHPSSVEWGRMPLPPSLTWSYMFARPIRLVAMFFKNRI